MARDVENIEFGPCNVSYNAVDIGFFTGGVTSVYTVEWYDVVVDQFSAPIDAKVMKEGILITVPMAETDLATLQQVMLTGTYTLDAAGTKKSLYAGGKQVSNSDFSQLIVTPTQDNSGTDSTSNNDKTTVFKAVPKIQWSKGYNRDTHRIVPVEFMGLADTSLDAGKNLVLFGDSTATA